MQLARRPSRPCRVKAKWWQPLSKKRSLVIFPFFKNHRCAFGSKMPAPQKKKKHGGVFIFEVSFLVLEPRSHQEHLNDLEPLRIGGADIPPGEAWPEVCDQAPKRREHVQPKARGRLGKSGKNLWISSRKQRKQQ